MLPELNAGQSLVPSTGAYRAAVKLQDNHLPTVYLDNNATTMPLPQVIHAMAMSFGNPSSLHSIGRRAMEQLAGAKSQIASLLKINEEELVFTSGGTESNNWAIKGTLDAIPDKKHLITTSVEHLSILHTCQALEKKSYNVTYLPVNSSGQLDLDLLEHSIQADTAIVSIMYANNETGVIFPIQEIAKIVKEKDCLLHVDAVQAFGKLPIELSSLPVDLMSFSGHKIHGPKGIGALFIRNGVHINPMITGGSQENGRRAGTENINAAVGFGIAASMAYHEMNENYIKTKQLRDYFEHEALELFASAAVHGDIKNRIPSTTCISFEGWDNKTLLDILDKNGICASGGSACCSQSGKISHVLDAMGLDPARARGAIRFSLSRFTTKQDIDYLLAVLKGVLNKFPQQRQTETVCTRCNLSK